MSHVRNPTSFHDLSSLFNSYYDDDDDDDGDDDDDDYDDDDDDDDDDDGDGDDDDDDDDDTLFFHYYLCFTKPPIGLKKFEVILHLSLPVVNVYWNPA